MIRLECTRVGALLQARAAGLSEASALRLEEHLTHCSNCSEQAHLLDGLRALSDASAQPLARGARQRAVLQAFAAAERPSQPMAARSSWLVPSLSGAMLAAAIVGLAILRQPQLGPLADYHAISGELEHTRFALGSRVETSIATRTGGVVALAQATVEFRPQTRARWNAQGRVLRLEEGSLVSDVDPAPHKSFQVDTDRFRVLVLGTRFEVSRSVVRVSRGRVRVETPDGSVLAELGPGDAYTCVSAPCRAKAPELEEPVPTQARAEAPIPSFEPGSAEPSSTRLQAAVRTVPPVAVEHLLDQVRAALGQHDVTRARDLVRSALAETLQSRERAEALSLRAECALVAGDLAGAAAGYRIVASRFANLPAGENALFAAARIDSDRLSGAAAQRGLQHYLARYPRGRFVKEATARLRELRASTPQP